MNIDVLPGHLQSAIDTASPGDVLLGKTPMTTTTLLLALLFSVPAHAADIHVAAGQSVQAAVDKAAPGDVIILQAGARFVGVVTLPAKAGPVTLRSSGTLPDRRVTPDDAPLMATLASGIGSAAIECTGCTNWILDGIRFEANTNGDGDVIAIRGGQHIVLRRLLIVVPDPQQQKRFVLGNGRNITLTQSHCSGVWKTGQDSQCFVAWDGAGPYTITDNYLEAASENVMFGGADSASEASIPADILVENNFFTKRLEWKGQPRNVKNLFELKAAKRVAVRNNVFERNWRDGQDGTAIVFTVRNQDGTAPWSTVEDVLFELNIVRDVPTHFNLLGRDNLQHSQQMTRITIRHNLLLGNGGGRMATMGNEVGVVAFIGNTYLQSPPAENSALHLYAEGSIKNPDGTSRVPIFAVQSFTFTDNLVQFNAWGVHSSLGMGSAALKVMSWTPVVWARNAFLGGSGVYPEGTTFLALSDAPSGPDYRHPDFGWTGQVPTPEPEPVPQPDLAAEIALLKAEIAVAKAEAASSRADAAVAVARLERLLAYLLATPNAKNIQQVVTYLRGVGK